MSHTVLLPAVLAVNPNAPSVSASLELENLYWKSLERFPVLVAISV
jgi:hypothetical protein